MDEREHSVIAVEDDPIVQLLLSGAATTLHEAEELYLNAALPEVLELLNSPLTNEELGRHPLMRMLVAHGSRRWEDSLF